MAYDYSECLAQAQSWVEQAIAEGRLSQQQGQRLLELDTRSPDTLFNTTSSHLIRRPLIVAFMGGTGVGKSSLLNRLAGQAIARAGVERPTSREVTLYHHQALSLQQLPSGLPLESIKISQHNDPAKSHIVFIDMPDFDSVELANKRLVLEWLPHIDVLLYVVSPERYRDNKAWQLLLAEGAKHAWLFVMNQWDRGQFAQLDDFKQQLGKAGFANPLIVRTSCSEPTGDQFSELLDTLQELDGQHNRQQLEQHGEQLRRQALHTILQQFLDDFARQDFHQLQQQADGLWQTAEASLRQGLAWPVQQIAKAYADNLANKATVKLWDEWAQNRLNDMLDEWLLQAEPLHIRSKSLKVAVQQLKADAGKTLEQQVELQGRLALMNPGNGVQRFLLRLTAICETLLPILAMAVVGYQVFSGYYHSAADSSAYLGVDFAVHSVLLIGLSWLIPFFLHKKISPSLQKAAFNGLHKGLTQALQTVKSEIDQLLAEEQQHSAAQLQRLQQLSNACVAEKTVSADQDGIIAQVLPRG